MSTAAAETAASRPPPSVGRFRVVWTARRVELACLALILAIALAFRLVGLGRIEPNVMPDEVDHLSLMYRVMAGHGPGPFDLSWDGNPAFSLYPSIGFLYLFGPSYISLRLSVAVASIAMLAVFYAVCRHRLPALPALAATALLAGSQWALWFSRNGEVNMFIALYGLVAVWCLQRALSGGRRLDWAGAGFWAGMGWYGFLGGVVILPSLCLGLAGRLIAGPHERRALLVGGAIMALTCALTVAPRVPTMITRWPDIQRYVDGRSVVRGLAVDAIGSTATSQISRVVRGFVLLDPSLDANRRYVAPGQAILDSTSGTLYVLGLLIAVWGLGAWVIWLSLLVVPIAATQLFTVGVPDTARCISALPAVFLLAALAIDRLLTTIPFRAVTRAAIIVGLPIVTWQNWQIYTAWQSTPGAAEARQPAIEYAEWNEWQAEHLRRAAANERALNVYEWRDSHPLSAVRATGRSSSPTASLQRDLGPLDANLVGTVQSGPGSRPLRAVAIGPRGDVIATDETGGLYRMVSGRETLEPIRRSPLAANAQAWDMVTALDGSLYIVDAEQSVLVKTNADGQAIATLGGDWGMYRPRGIGIAPDGLLYVADTGRNRIVIADTDGRMLKSIGGDGPGKALGFDQPTDVAVDANGHIFVVMPEAGRLVVVDEEANMLGDWKIAKGNTLNSPRIALSEQGHVIVSEPGDKRVLIFDQTGRRLGAIDQDLAAPFGLTVAGSRLYLTDIDRNVVRTYDLKQR